ncbi:MAG: hypothetical protein NT171_06750 [Planctomycetota bacterium]|nr:hypothetical protein [Planctomycetota bacterium]
MGLQMTDCAVFELAPILDNPLYEGMASGDTPSVLGRRRVHDDFFPASYDAWEWALEPLAEKWKPIRVEGRTRSFNDFPCLDMMVPAFSRRAVDALRDYLEPNGELLQLMHPAGEYYAFNCRTVAEVMDHTRTIAPWRPSQPRMTQSVDYYAIDLLSVRSLTVFRMREMPNRVFVTNSFVDRARTHGLNGFHFIKVWPFPEGTDYWLEDKNQDDLDAQLFTPTLDDPYFGSLEGKKTAKGITKLYLSCPDAEALFGKLSDWLKVLDWQPRPTVLVRNVSFDDFSAGGREVVV